MMNRDERKRIQSLRQMRASVESRKESSRKSSAGLPVPREPAYVAKRSQDGEAPAASGTLLIDHAVAGGGPQTVGVASRRSGNRFWGPRNRSTRLTSLSSVGPCWRKCHWPGYRLSSPLRSLSSHRLKLTPRRSAPFLDGSHAQIRHGHPRSARGRLFVGCGDTGGGGDRLF